MAELQSMLGGEGGRPGQDNGAVEAQNHTAVTANAANSKSGWDTLDGVEDLDMVSD